MLSEPLLDLDPQALSAGASQRAASADDSLRRASSLGTSHPLPSPENLLPERVYERYNMATRSLTSRFLEIKDNFRRSHSFMSRPPAFSTQGQAQKKLLEDFHTTPDTYLDASIKALPPGWVDILEDVKHDMQLIKNKMNELKQIHKKRTRIRFDDQHTQTDQDIEIQTREITRLFHKCETGLKKIATFGLNTGNKISQDEISLRKNAMRQIASNLQTLSSQFRNEQKLFLHRLQGHEQKGKSALDFASQPGDSDDDMTIINMDAKQIRMIDESQASAKRRYEEIQMIAKNIQDLATIFKELSVLVIDQGTVLDRIDYNIEQASTKVKQGNRELIIADKHSKRSRSMMLIILLLIIIAILGIVVVVRAI